jgi:uncharacterized protein YdcH (DUF465 family)
MSTTHLDQALAEASDRNFRALLEQNHDLWKQIQQIQKGIAPADDAVLENLEKRRLVILDQIGAHIG